MSPVEAEGEEAWRQVQRLPLQGQLGGVILLSCSLSICFFSMLQFFFNMTNTIEIGFILSSLFLPWGLCVCTNLVCAGSWQKFNGIFTLDLEVLQLSITIEQCFNEFTIGYGDYMVTRWQRWLRWGDDNLLSYLFTPALTFQSFKMKHTGIFWLVLCFRPQSTCNYIPYFRHLMNWLKEQLTLRQVHRKQWANVFPCFTHSCTTIFLSASLSACVQKQLLGNRRRLRGLTTPGQETVYKLL